MSLIVTLGFARGVHMGPVLFGGVRSFFKGDVMAGKKIATGRRSLRQAVRVSQRGQDLSQGRVRPPLERAAQVLVAASRVDQRMAVLTLTRETSATWRRGAMLPLYRRSAHVNHTNKLSALVALKLTGGRLANSQIPKSPVGTTNQTVRKMHKGQYIVLIRALNLNETSQSTASVAAYRRAPGE
jgi:hypothetical protein